MASWCFVLVLLSLRRASGKQTEGAALPMRDSAQRTATVIVNARGESSVDVQEPIDYDDYSYYSSALGSSDEYDSYYGLGSSDEYESYYGLGSSDEYYYSYELGKSFIDEAEHAVSSAATSAGHVISEGASDVSSAATSAATVAEHPEKFAKYELCTKFLKVAAKKTVGAIVKKALTGKGVTTVAKEGICVEGDLDIAGFCAAGNVEDGELGAGPCAAVAGEAWTGLCNKILKYGTNKFLEDLGKLTNGVLTTDTACASLGYKKP